MKQKMRWTGAALFVAAFVFIEACKKTPPASPTDVNAEVARAVVSTPNIVFTLAGDTTNGFVDGVSSGARFNEVAGIAIDSSGNHLYYRQCIAARPLHCRGSGRYGRRWLRGHPGKPGPW